MKKNEAIRAVNQYGMLLVYPIKNTRDPNSLWQVWHPRKKMNWEWDDGGDDSVPVLWHLRAELSESRKVIYSKWFRGRATLFSLELFQSLLAVSIQEKREQNLSRDAREIYSILNESSPQSIRILKKETNLVGKAFEPQFTKAMKELWDRFLIIGYGEIDDGAFPSLAIGSTRALFEDLYLEAGEMDLVKAKALIQKKIGASPAFQKFYLSQEKKLFRVH